jgi:hypothetical protein
VSFLLKSLPGFKHSLGMNVCHSQGCSVGRNYFEKDETMLKMNLTLGDQVTSVNPDNVLKIVELIRANRRITVLELSQEVGISVGSVEEILHNE